MNRLRSLRIFAADGSGAVYVEFLVAIVPMLTLFWGLMQLNGILLADLVTRNAAQHAVRAAVVCGTGKLEGGQSSESAATECANEAAKAVMKSVASFAEPGKDEPQVTTTVRGASEHGNQDVTAIVSGHYHCEVPMVGAALCALVNLTGPQGAQSGPLVITHEATFPNQGHYYKF
jgi:Flp pilus assembly protein TadG